MKIHYSMYVNYYLSLTACSSGTKVLDRGEYKEFKYCAHCKKIMVWRKSWERNWNEVKFCRFMCVNEFRSLGVYMKKRKCQQFFAMSKSADMKHTTHTHTTVINVESSNLSRGE